LEVEQWNRQYKLGKTFDSSTGFNLPDNSMRSPDTAWITNEKWNRLSAEQKERFLPFAPDFLVEVLSHTDHLAPAREKMNKWIQNGALLAWLIIPKQQLVFIYRADGTVDKVEGFSNSLSGEDVMPDFEFDLSVLL
jgi:Uma2 family endonuclease